MGGALAGQAACLPRALAGGNGTRRCAAEETDFDVLVAHRIPKMCCGTIGRVANQLRNALDGSMVKATGL
jgi:hypothetical protein